MKKGFTLLELLAVIVILAILSLIITPLVMNLIEQSRISSASSSALNYIEAFETEVMEARMNQEGIEFRPNVIYKVFPDQADGLKLNDFVEIKGNLPTGKDDYLLLNQNMVVKEGNLTFGSYIVVIENETVSKVVKQSDGEVEIDLKKDVSTNITNDSNLDIANHYFETNSVIKPVCKVNDQTVVNTNDLVKVGLLGNYPVTCTLKDKSASVTLNMDTVYFYKEGNEFTNLTGGWLLNANRIPYKPEIVDTGWVSAGSQYATAVKNNNNLYLKSGLEATQKYCGVGMKNMVNIENYSKLKVQLNIVKTRTDTTGIMICLTTDVKSTIQYPKGEASSILKTYEFDISSFDVNKLEIIALSVGSSVTEFSVQKVWLEK